MQPFEERRTPADMPWLAPPAVLERALFSTLPAGATIVRAGERAQQVEVLVEGAVDEIVGGLVVRHEEAGTLLGADRAGGELPATSTLRAVTRVVLVNVLVRDLVRVTGNPEVAWWLRSQWQSRELAIERSRTKAGAAG